MKNTKVKAKLPMNYDNYVFDFYGTLTDIRTDEKSKELWEKLALFFGYYKAVYSAKELEAAYDNEVSKITSGNLYSHEMYPEADILEVFKNLYRNKGIEPSLDLAVHTGQIFRMLSTEFIFLYEGTKDMLINLKKNNKKVWLLSNAQRIFTEYEMNMLGITDLFDGILISSDYGVKKPDIRFFNKLKECFALDVSKSIYVGNDVKCDVLGAKQIGLDTFYVKSDISPSDDKKPESTYCVMNFDGWEI